MRAALRLTATLLGLAVLAGCGSGSGTTKVARLAPADIALPSMKVPPGARAAAPTRSNRSIANDFILLSFYLESGRALPVLSRFEGPISIRMTGSTASPAASRDLDRLISRLRNEAKIPITRVARGDTASITVEFIPQKTLRRAAPNAACFVAPRVTSWNEFARTRGTATQDWTTLSERKTMSIFLPGNVSSQEVRDCLHEEISQALGPVNDLYHLDDSIFNDDNFHTVLTGFDMVILRAFYDGSLRSGMTSDQVRAGLPAILSRINPAGKNGPTPASDLTPNSWRNDIQTALGVGTAGSRKLAAAKHAVAFARASGWHDNRLGFALYAQGRLALARDRALALASFSEAEALFRANPATQLHAAHVAVQSAAFALSSGDAARAIKIADINSPLALRAENASLLATLLMLKAQALESLGRADDARIVRLDSLGWARYGLGSDKEIRQRLGEIAALSPASRQRQ